MMTSVNIQLIVHYVMIILSKGLTETKAQGYGNQSRDVYYTTTFDQDISKRGRSSTELPVAFQAPDPKSPNFWNYRPERRTFFEDFKYLNYGNRNAFPNLNSFFQFMSPLFDRGRTGKPPAAKQPEPYKYEYPFKYLSSTERNFLPPPKPLRASIVKLETVTKPPDWQVPFRYVPPVVHITQPSTLPPPPVDTRPNLFIDELGFHSDNNINFRRDSNWLTQKVPTVEPYQAQPTEPPSTELDINVTATPIIQENDTQPTTEDTTEIPDNTQDDEESSKKALQLVIINTVNKYNMINNLKINKNDSRNDTLGDNAEGTAPVEDIKPYKKSNTIKIVTDLTLEGLQKNKKSAVNVPRYTKFLNMSNLINYELNKLKQNKLMKPRSDFVEKEEFNGGGFNDDLSLDLKILKDTNWDGFTTETTVKLSPTETETDTKQTTPEGDNQPTNTTKTEGVNNQTIIVETRVTKSVSKSLPSKKYYRFKERKRPSKEVNQKPIPPEVETNATTVEPTEEKDKTIITLGKKFDVEDNKTSAEVTYRSRRRKYRYRGTQNPSSTTTETITEEPEKPLNVTTINIETETLVTTEIPTTTPRKKPRRRTKRRRTGKRRKTKEKQTTTVSSPEKMADLQ